MAIPTAQIAAPITLAIENLPARHVAGAGEHRDDGAHERDEAGEHDGARAALVEELLSLFEVLGLEDPRVAA